MADKTQNVKTRLSFDGEAEYKAACKEINSTLKVLNSEMKLVIFKQCRYLVWCFSPRLTFPVSKNHYRKHTTSRQKR